MKSALELILSAKKERAEKIIQAEHGDAALDALYNFSDLDCIVDVKLEEGWIRYVFIEGDDDDGTPDSLRKIG